MTENQDKASATNVIWIASYPKSGNTWVQSVVRRAGGTAFSGFGGKDLDVYKLIAEKRLPATVGRIRPDVGGPGTTVLKTHGRYTPGRELHRELRLRTTGFAYVMRNPLDLLLSYINFTRMQYEKKKQSPKYQEALFIEFLGFDRAVPYEEWVNTKLEDIPRPNLDHSLTRFMELKTELPGMDGTSGTWLDHCFSWLEAGKTLPSAILRYEDLLEGPERFLPLRRLFDFSEAEVASAVNGANQSARAMQGESIFFNKMGAYYYPHYFSAAAIGRFLDRYRDELRTLGYGDLPISV